MYTQLVLSANGKPSLSLGPYILSAPHKISVCPYMHLFLLLLLATPSLLYFVLSHYILVYFTVPFVQSHFRALFS